MLQYVLYVKSVGDGVNFKDSDEESINVSFSAGVYTLVTNASTLAVGDKVIIVAKDYNYAMSTTQNSSNRGQIDITKNGNTIDITGIDTVQVFTLEEGTKTGTFAFNTGSGYIYAAGSSTSKQNYLKTKTTLDDNGSWTITIASESATITGQGTSKRKILQYNSSNNPPIFSCYDGSQKAVQIYKK